MVSAYGSLKQDLRKKKLALVSLFLCLADSQTGVVIAFRHGLLMLCCNTCMSCISFSRGVTKSLGVPQSVGQTGSGSGWEDLKGLLCSGIEGQEPTGAYVCG